MTISRYALLVLILWLAPLETGLANTPPPLFMRVMSEAPALQAHTTQLIVRSQAADRDFQIEVTPPYTPPLLPGQKAPVVYVLDGGYGLAGPTGRLLGGAGTMAPAYIVTIGYPPGGPYTRERDLLSSPATRPDGAVAKGGGAAAFQAFLLDELRPYIEARYPIDGGAAVLFGHSLSGVFTANLLADKPEAFGGYLIASPSVWADATLLRRLAAMRSKADGQRVFVGYGADEEPHMIDGARRVAEALSGDPGHLVLKAQAFTGEQHISYYPVLMSAAFPFLLPRATPIRRPSPIILTPAQAHRYFGTYSLSDGRKVTIGEDEDGMLLQVDGLDPTNIHAEAPDRFYVHGVDARLTFESGDGPPSILTLYVNGAEAVARRVK